MTAPVSVVEAALLKVTHPGVVTRIVHWPLLHPHVTATDARAGIHRRHEARIVRLSDHHRSEATVEHVVPGIQLCDGEAVASGQKVTKVMGDIDDGFIRANTVEGRNL